MLAYKRNVARGLSKQALHGNLNMELTYVGV